MASAVGSWNAGFPEAAMSDTTFAGFSRSVFLELVADGFHRAGTNRGVAGGQVGIVEVVAVVLKVVDFPIEDRIGGIPGQ